MNFLLISTVVLSIVCVASYSKTAQYYLDCLCQYFSHEIGRISTSVPKRLAFNLGIITFFALTFYGLFKLCMMVECGDDLKGDCYNSITYQGASGIISLLCSFLISKLVVKTIMIGKKLISSRQRSQSMGHYWRDIYPHEQHEVRVKQPSCFPSFSSKKMK